jgi:hypothetical protein
MDSKALEGISIRKKFSGFKKKIGAGTSSKRMSLYYSVPKRLDFSMQLIEN